MATVVVGYLRKPEGEAALERGIEEARLRAADLVVVDARRPAAPAAPAPDGPDGSDESDGSDELDARLRESGVAFVVRRLTTGEPPDDLVGVAREHDADLIVIGLRRRSPVGKLVLGSHAQRVLLDAPCPVLAVTA